MINVNQLYFTYPANKHKTIKGMSFRVEEGEIFGFLGPSGAGKSTAQKILIGILKGYSGSVSVMGKEISNVDKDYYEKIGVSFELPNLYNKFTALENLNFFSSLYSGSKEDPKQLLESVGLEQHAHSRVSSFSKGMKMRLNLVRSLLNKPELIFLDEPTSGLDPVNMEKVKDIILNKKVEGKTIFLTTHNMNVAEEICDRVAFVIDGQINVIDSPRELKLRYGQKKLQIEYRENHQMKSSVFSMEGLRDNEEFMNIIKFKDIERMHTQEAMLQDIFIKVTGREII
ncbi:ABC transporter ATP-binding protein [Gracilibacillus sp. S3-1-1]|uniref:ABC transporter ATP-binding protein n=1 Tax=Gracilibacillus pellucidus TaxID=3095368 RepID=A0ACC6M8D6_9BACI|nr:ABC transporter ATP-binding protein [Gracilibacillus sp. S3-1-1]MDX8047245.1 ABC transporter ATP-binding protein [Gracilibacillus sp. S3-1-1]